MRSDSRRPRPRRGQRPGAPNAYPAPLTTTSQAPGYQQAGYPESGYPEAGYQEGGGRGRSGAWEEAPRSPGEPGEPGWPEAVGNEPSGPGPEGPERREVVPAQRAPRPKRADLRRGSARAFVRTLPRSAEVTVQGGSLLHLLVLACTAEDTTAVDLTSGALLRLRVSWPPGHEPDLAAFDVVEAHLAADPERDDLAQPEATTGEGLPRQVGTLRGRRVRRLLKDLAVTPAGELLGFRGPAAPYWEFRGIHPSVALIVPSRGPQILRRADGSTWIRFGWHRDDVWLPMEDRQAARALDAARRDRLSGKALATALGFRPQYLLASVSQPREGHCYKVITAILPRG